MRRGLLLHVSLGSLAVLCSLRPLRTPRRDRQIYMICADGRAVHQCRGRPQMAAPARMAGAAFVCLASRGAHASGCPLASCRSLRHARRGAWVDLGLRLAFTIIIWSPHLVHGYMFGHHHLMERLHAWLVVLAPRSYLGVLIGLDW